MEIELIDNKDKSRFEVEIQDKMAIMDYKKKAKDIISKIQENEKHIAYRIGLQEISKVIQD